MTWSVFYSYSHLDADFRHRLSTYLAPLERMGKIVEWYDRKIDPGTNWATEINTKLETANLILLLVSENFLASDYCFGVEVERALMRLKQDNVKVVPILLKPCLWDESRFRELQIIPREAKPISSWSSQDEAFLEVAKEIRNIVSVPPPISQTPLTHQEPGHFISASLDIVMGQVRAYANLYEKIRQRMRASGERTQRMEQVFQNMRALATASYPLLAEFVNSPSPGEKLAAVAILQVFANSRYLSFLVKLVSEEKPFVGYHAIKALRFAVGALDPIDHLKLLEAIGDTQTILKKAGVGLNTDRWKVLADAEHEIKATIDSLAGNY